MKEAEWLACRDPEPMLQFLGSQLSNRKRWLFSCACVRRVWDLLTDERSRHAVEVFERYAEGQASSQELAVALSTANLVPGASFVVSAAAHAFSAHFASTCAAFAVPGR